MSYMNDIKEEFDESVRNVIDDFESACGEANSANYTDVDATRGNDILEYIDVHIDFTDLEALNSLSSSLEDAGDELSAAADEAENLATCYRDAESYVVGARDLVDNLINLIENAPIAVGDTVRLASTMEDATVIGVKDPFIWVQQGDHTPATALASSVVLVSRAEPEEE